MKKGIIMEIRRDVLIMMTPDGQFMNGKKSPDGRYAIGEEITFFPMKASSTPVSRNKWKPAAAILTAAILMITLFSVSFLQSNKAYAYVSVDINPSIELTLNKQNEVIDITPYNEDGKILIKKLEDWDKEDVSEVTGEILRLSDKLGYLRNDQNVWITSTLTDSSDSGNHSALLKDLNSFIKQYNSMHSSEIIMNETTEDLREKALKRGLTAGALLKEAVKSEQAEPVKPAGAAAYDDEGDKNRDSNPSSVKKESQAPETSRDHVESEPKNDVGTDSTRSKGKGKTPENKTNERDKHFEQNHPSQKKNPAQGKNSDNENNGNRGKSENSRENSGGDKGRSNEEKRTRQENSQQNQSAENKEKKHKDKNHR
jgi:Anti-sigma factor N-terminus